MIIMNWIPIGLNWTILFKCLEMTIVVIWRYINKTELNWIEYVCYWLLQYSQETKHRKTVLDKEGKSQNNICMLKKQIKKRVGTVDLDVHLYYLSQLPLDCACNCSSLCDLRHWEACINASLYLKIWSFFFPQMNFIS